MKKFIQINIENLRPTQFAVGMIEVAKKVNKIKNKNNKEIDEYLKEHLIPVILGPNNQYHLVDHHHLVRACWEANLSKVPCIIRSDLSKEGLNFWKTMEKNHWVYLYDQFGNGPHSTEVLPHDITCLGDDPFRSLSWAVRDKGGYTKTTTFFSEFTWAEFFRKKLKVNNDPSSFEKSVISALKLAKSKVASHLPGWLGSK